MVRAGYRGREVGRGRGRGTDRGWFTIDGGLLGGRIGVGEGEG